MNKEFKVGLLLVISGTLLYFSFNFLKGKDFFSSTNKYYATYADVAGLTISNPVIINGFAVGRVDEILIMHEKNDSLQVMFVIDDGVIMNNLTVAELISSDILGGKAIKLELNNGKELLQSGSFVKSRVEESLAAIIERTAVPVITNVDTIVNDFKKYMRGGNEKNITKSIEGIRLMIEEMNKFSRNLNATLVKNSGNISETGDNLKIISGKINDEMKNINKILKNVNNIT